MQRGQGQLPVSSGRWAQAGERPQLPKAEVQRASVLDWVQTIFLGFK
jgi:hypothetical protein